MDNPQDPSPDRCAVTVSALQVYPIKSCAGVSLPEALLIETGLELDRTWMVVDETGSFVTQRELPRMALVTPTLKSSEMVLRAPGMLALHVALDRVESATRATVWGDNVAAYDMGGLCAQWFSDFLGQRLRLVRFDPLQQRPSDRAWTGDVVALNAFSDGFPLLVASAASLDEVNRRLAVQAQPPVSMTRFRPNLVLAGLDAHGEDALDEIRFESEDGPVRLRLVKPCARCPIPDVDPVTARTGHAVRDTLAQYRADPRVKGKITFGMNAIVVEGQERALRVGLGGLASFRFD